MARTEDRFLRRWSRLKQKDRRRKEQPGAEKESAPPQAGDATAPPPDLPDIESLDKDSDFSVFLKDGVPDELRTLALRKLWRTDPAFAVIDGLDDYDEDYRTAMVVAEKLAKGLKTARKGTAEKAAEERTQGDGPPAEGRAKAPARARRQGEKAAPAGRAAKARGRSPEPKREDDSETG